MFDKDGGGSISIDEIKQTLAMSISFYFIMVIDTWAYNLFIFYTNLY